VDARIKDERAQRRNPETVKMNLALTPPQLMALYAKLGDELRRRGVARNSNNATGVD